ncbi:hypothetical protein F5888DRAFT_1694365 [Russula emetica]|nr:hypothetical protein F5888DRAFT_1694365 [Russula emetica]
MGSKERLSKCAGFAAGVVCASLCASAATIQKRNSWWSYLGRLPDVYLCQFTLLSTTSTGLHWASCISASALTVESASTMAGACVGLSIHAIVERRLVVMHGAMVL